MLTRLVLSSLLLLAACTREPVPVPAVSRIEIADLPGVWSVVPRGRRPHVVWGELARAHDPSSPTWRQIPAGSGDEAIVFSHALPSDAVMRCNLTGTDVSGAKVVLRLIGKGQDEFWPLWVWRPESPRDSVSFTANVPAGGEWVGGVITVAGPNPGLARVEVKSLIIEHSRVRSDRPNLVLITLDTFRADHLSCIRPGAAPTPTLDSLAAAGTLFEQAVSTSQCTGPSHCSMLTGLYCFAHGVYQNHEGLSPDAMTAAEALSAEGYRTLGAVSIAHLNSASSNLNQGFAEFLDSRWPRLGGEPADIHTARVLRELQLRSQDGRPWFIWIHYFDPHTPYTPPDGYAEMCGDVATAASVRYLRGMGTVAFDSATGLVLDPAGEVSRYCGETVFLDRQLGTLFAGLRRLGLLDHGAVAVMADHGEGLGEHGIYFEHAGMFQEVLHVPLIVSGAGFPAGKRVATRVSGVDVFPTLLSRAGVRSMPPNYGKDLLPLARGTRGPRHSVIFSESVSQAICAAWEGDEKLVWIPDDKPQDWSVPERMMLFNLAMDPGESSNLITAAHGRGERLKKSFVEAVRTPLVSLQAQQGSADRDRLRALGYIQ